ncbi:membrane hypothetical protein [Burkholderia diffusa]|uniref:hypothetical protein n=1 Tax=Burkholderia diffusa TaxID=488732 RepID=UPI001CB60F7C|nr:hypothetical protein [Burkholderia diffusa]CAG9248547.1 membrane hypothetical protein [Burkholderia diffusa]
MLDELFDVLGNSHFEAWIAGPLMGILYAAILFGFGRPPSDKEKGKSPEDVQKEIDTRVPKKEVHHHHYHNGTGGSTDDGSVVFVIAAVLGVVGLFLLTAYLPKVSIVLHIFNAATAVFCIVTVGLMTFSGRFNTAQWWLRVVFPVVASIVCFWLTIQARDGIRPDVVAYARSLLASGPLSVALVIQAVISFLKAIGNEYFLWIEFIGAAFVCIAFCSVITMFQCVHFVSLSNLRAGRTRGWLWLAVKTEKFGGGKSIVLATVLLVIGGLLATGTVYGWIHPNLPVV